MEIVLVTGWFVAGLIAFHLLGLLVEAHKPNPLLPSDVWCVLGGPIVLAMMIGVAIKIATNREPHV